MTTADSTIKTPEDLFATFEAWGIEVTTHKHEAVFTVEESSKLDREIPGAHTKNLFIRTKKGDKGNFYLVVMLQDKSLDLKALAEQLSEGKFSFGSDKRLMAKLGLTPGSVTPFGVINPTAQDVQVILDADMMEHELLNYHPLINTMTTTIKNADFIKFLEKTGHSPKILKLPKR